VVGAFLADIFSSAQAGSSASAPAEVSPGLVAWMLRHRLSLVCSSYRTGRLLFIGARSNGRPTFSRAQFSGAMGLAAFSQRIYVAARTAIWRLENALRPDELVDDRFDRLFVPRNAQFTGQLGTHELAVEPSGRIVFVATKYSCLATISMTHAFKALWKPAFVSRLAPEDRCHLNGLAMDEGRVRYATACSTTDIVDGWRERRADGGVLIDVVSDRVVVEGFSMPHSPRVNGGAVWLLDSGSGQLCRVDPNSGRREDVAFCPGFLRGLAFVGSYAIVTLSLPRRGRFQGLALDNALTRRGAEPWCGLMIIDTRHGDVVEWVRFANESELFDVAAIPLTRCPTAIAAEGSDMQDAITFEDTTASRTTVSGPFRADKKSADRRAVTTPEKLARHVSQAR
jgi:uncharacterized protein (TIGR03032 family)